MLTPCELVRGQVKKGPETVSDQCGLFLFQPSSAGASGGALTAASSGPGAAGNSPGCAAEPRSLPPSSAGGQ